MKHTLALALAGFAALGLAAPRPAAAQGGELLLNSGDAVGVTGAGTTGLYNGAAVTAPMSGYTSYTDTSGANANGHNAVVETQGTASFTLGTGGSLLDTTGGTSGQPASPARGFGLYASGNGAIAVTGGSISADDYGTGLYALNSGPIVFSVGTVSATYAGNGLHVFGANPLTLSGGRVSVGSYGTGLVTGGAGSVTLSSGSIDAGYSGIGWQTYSSGPVVMSGGSLTTGAGGIALEVGYGTVTITGGVIKVGAGGVGLFVSGGATDLFGTGFMYTPTGGAPTPIVSGFLPSGGSTGSITGTLLNGDPLSTTYDNFSTLQINAAPEPSQSAAFALGLLGLGGLALRARMGTARV